MEGECDNKFSSFYGFSRPDATALFAPPRWNEASVIHTSHVSHTIKIYQATACSMTP